jgi:uroporphyrin-III C-methyltransferase
MRASLFTSHKSPKLTLVGAGPGDAELITLKGINALKQADIVLFDALVSQDILDFIPSGIPALSVGKRAGSSSSYAQEEINELIVEMAFLYGHVVRLKGGDPFVFGRGYEEIEFAEQHGLETTVVPGITSAIAVPASLKIPVTSRGVSESFWVITGTTKTGALSGDIELAAQSTATTVILMGSNKLDEIMELFKKHGRSHTPAAIIQNGTLSNQRQVIATVSTLARLASEEDIGSPAVIVVGDVVRYAHEIDKILVSPNVLKNYQ